MCRCSNEAARLVINPVQSARLRTTGTFTFQYGRLEVRPPHSCLLYL